MQQQHHHPPPPTTTTTSYQRAPSLTPSSHPRVTTRTHSTPPPSLLPPSLTDNEPLATQHPPPTTHPILLAFSTSLSPPSHSSLSSTHPTDAPSPIHLVPYQHPTSPAQQPYPRYTSLSDIRHTFSIFRTRPTLSLCHPFKAAYITLSHASSLPSTNPSQFDCVHGTPLITSPLPTPIKRALTTPRHPPPPDQQRPQHGNLQEEGQQGARRRRSLPD